VINITTRTTIVLNVQLDDNIRISLLEEEGLSRRQNKVFGQSIPIRGSETLKVQLPTSQSDHQHHQVTGAGRAECPLTVQICYSVEWSKVKIDKAAFIIVKSNRSTTQQAVALDSNEKSDTARV